VAQSSASVKAAVVTGRDEVDSDAATIAEAAVDGGNDDNGIASNLVPTTMIGTSDGFLPAAI
jgi:hypothetical protein